MEKSFLCDECKPLGYCRKYTKTKENNYTVISRAEGNFQLPPGLFDNNTNPSLQITDLTKSLTDTEIKNWVNVRTDNKEANTKFGRKLQQAHDLFHQDEFEQASYLYLDILQTRNDCEEAWKGIAAAYYFLGKYADAESSSAVLNNRFDNGFNERFTKKCEKMLLQIEKDKSNQDLPVELDFSIATIQPQMVLKAV